MPGKIVNIGSLCIDYVYRVPRIVSEGVTLASTQRQVFAGGKGLNQSVAAARAGAEVVHCGAIGPDGDLLVETLEGAGARIDQIVTINEPSGHAVIQVNPDGQNAIVIHGGANRTLTPAYVDAATRNLSQHDWVLLQNEVNDLDLIISAAKGAGAKVALNLAPADERIADYPIDLLDLLIVNIDEAAALVAAKALGEPGANADEHFAQLVKAYPHTSLVLTQGSAGLLCHEAGSEHRMHMGTIKVDAVDETAAGDSFVGYCLASLARGDELHQALRLGTIAGALAVTREGAAPSVPSPAEVEARLPELPEGVTSPV
ncbi:MAG: ribokinase [Pseudomonadota bacterium]